MAGVPTTIGSQFLSGYVPAYHATVVSRVLDEGQRTLAITGKWYGIIAYTSMYAMASCLYGPTQPFALQVCLAISNPVRQKYTMTERLLGDTLKR